MISQFGDNNLPLLLRFGLGTGTFRLVPTGPADRMGEESLCLVSSGDLEIGRGAIYQYRGMATAREEVKRRGRIDSSDKKSKTRAA